LSHQIGRRKSDVNEKDVKKVFNKNDAVVQCNRCDTENAMCVFTANYIVTGNFI